MTARPEVIAHRGASADRPDNTLSAFLRALDVGADAIELDVHATKDGVVVVHHDPAIRVTRGDRDSAALIVSICDERYQDLRDLRVQGERIPTLAEVLTETARRAITYVEIKGYDIEQEVVDVIRRSPARDHCAVHSFNHRAVRRVHEIAPEIPTGILLSSYLTDPVHALESTGARDYWQSWDFVDEALADAVHDNGGRLIAWTPWDAHDLMQLAEDGVDGICVDDPARAIDIFKQQRP